MSIHFERFLRMKNLANYSAKPEHTYTQKDGSIRKINSREASEGLIGVSDKTIRLWIQQGTFPAPTKLSTGVTVWKASEIEAWMKCKSAKDMGGV